MRQGVCGWYGITWPSHTECHLGCGGERPGEQLEAFGTGEGGSDASVEEAEADWSDGDAIGSGTAFDDSEGANGEVFTERQAVIAGGEIDVEAGGSDAFEIKCVGSRGTADGKLNGGGDVLQCGGFSIGEAEAACGANIAGSEYVLSGAEGDISVASGCCGQQGECIITGSEVHQQVSSCLNGLGLCFGCVVDELAEYRGAGELIGSDGIVGVHEQRVITGSATNTDIASGYEGTCGPGVDNGAVATSGHIQQQVLVDAEIGLFESDVDEVCSGTEVDSEVAGDGQVGFELQSQCVISATEADGDAADGGGVFEGD